jgi:hypothetical protein
MFIYFSLLLDHRFGKMMSSSGFEFDNVDSFCTSYLCCDV